MIESAAFGLSTQNKSPNKILDLGVGQPLLSKFPIDIYDKFYKTEGINKYYPSVGDQELRSLILKKYYPNLSMDNIAITNGAIGALDFVFRMMASEDTSVLIPDPGFPPYEKLAKFSNHKVLKYKIALKDDDQLINWDSVFEKIDDSTKILLLNSPHNPTGKILHNDEIKNINFLLEKYPQLNLVLDEVYRDLIYDNNKHINLTSLLSRTYFIGSFSKVFPIQGARIGWVVTCQDKLEGLLPFFHNVNGAVSSYGQEIAKSFLKRNLSFLEEYKESRIKVLNELEKYKIDFIYPKGAFYIFIRVKGNDQTFRLQLENQGVKVISGNDFGENGKSYIRISFAQDFKIIREAIRLIANTLKVNNEVH